MKKAAAALLATAAGVVWLVSFRVTPEHVEAVQPAATPEPPSPASPQPEPSGPPPSPTPTPAPGTLKDGSYTGRDISTIFGDVQVRLVVKGGKISDAQALRLPSDRARSALISQYAGPILRQETIQAQSAEIDILSGASYTSYAYAESVDDALRQAR